MINYEKVVKSLDLLDFSAFLPLHLFWSNNPTEKHPNGCFSVGGATLLSIALVAQSAANRFAFAARRSASSLARRRASESSPKVKFRDYSKRKADPMGRLFCWRRHPFIDRARRAKRGEPVRIRRPEICKLACKAKGERIFTEGEIPGLQ